MVNFLPKKTLQFSDLVRPYSGQGRDVRSLDLSLLSGLPAHWHVLPELSRYPLPFALYHTVIIVSLQI